MNYRAARSGSIVAVSLKVFRSASDWNATAWERSHILTIPDHLKPKLVDINIAGSGVEGVGFQLDPSGIYVRPFKNVNITKNSWVSASFAYPIG